MTKACGGVAGDSSLQQRSRAAANCNVQTQGLVDKSVSIANIACAEDAQRAASPESGGGRGRAIRGGEKRAGG
jgi:hypothetical protein